MPRWIVFEERTATALQARSHGQIEISSGNLIDAALASLPAVALLAGSDGRVLLAGIRRNAGVPTASSLSYSAGGFLGLTDELVLEEEPPRPKRWWQKLFE